jgi:hypothetical protein
MRTLGTAEYIACFANERYVRYMRFSSGRPEYFPYTATFLIKRTLLQIMGVNIEVNNTRRAGILKSGLTSHSSTQRAAAERKGNYVCST